MPFLIAKILAIASTAPAAPSRWPVIDFVELIFNLYAWTLVLLPTLLGLYWWLYSRKAVVDMLPFALVVITMGLYLSLDGAYQPAVLNAKSDKPTATDIARLIPPGHDSILVS